MKLSNRSALNLAALVAFGTMLPQLSFALSSYTWNGATNSTWDTTSANWTGSTTTWVNGTGTSANDAVFTSGTTVTLGATPISVHYINSAGNTFINSGTLVLDSGTSAAASGTAGPTLNAGAGTLTISSIITGTRGLVANGGTIVVSSTATYTGITTVNGGTLKLGANNVLPTATTLSTFGAGRTLDINGFNQTVANIQGSNGIIRNTASGTATFTINGTANSATGIQFAGALNFAYASTGTLTLNASNGALNYTGSTTISAGTVILNTATSGLVSSSAVNVNGGTLASTVAGTLTLGAGNVTMSAGSINPGQVGSIAGFTVATNKNFLTTGGTIRMDLDTTSSLDQIFGGGTGTFSLTNTTLALNLLTWTTPDYANTYTIFSGFNSGSISNLTITGYDTTNYLASLSNTGVLSFTAVPEPSSVALLASAGIATLLYRRRRRNA